jgi:hypothetical protein
LGHKRRIDDVGGRLHRKRPWRRHFQDRIRQRRRIRPRALWSASSAPLVCGERIRSSILIHTDVFGESGHLGFEWLELQHEELDADCMKFLDAAGDVS